MPTFAAPDGTPLAYHLHQPMIAVPGGPMMDSAYLGDLGGLPGLIRLDLRGTGASGTPSDPATYRSDRQVDDIEALRKHLGLDRLTLLAHCAGTNIAVLYAARHPERIERLVFVTPSTFAVGITATVDQRRAVVRLRAGEPWYEGASAAFERINAGQPADGDFDAIAPLTYGFWNPEHYAMGGRNNEAAAIFGSEGAYHPDITRTALANLDVPVLVIAGAHDVAAPPPVVAEFAGLFPNAKLVVLPGAGHFPWLDAPKTFAATITT